METERDAAIFRYMNKVDAFPRLNREQEAALCRSWRDSRDARAKDELVRTHLRFVVMIALKYRHCGAPLAELVAEGNLGLLHAVDKFDPDRGLRFLTYAAYWIRAHILNVLTHSRSLVGSGSGVFRSRIYFKLRRERARIANLVGEGDAALDLLAKKFDTTPANMGEMVRRVEARDVPLDSFTFADGASSTLVETLAAPDCDQEAAYFASECEKVSRVLVALAMRALDPRERFIVEHRIMKDPEVTMSLAQLGRRFGVSRERARQLEVRAINKLRRRIEAIRGEHLAGTCFGSAA